MKICIVTVYKGNNYGAFFQAYALQEYLKSFGHEVFFLAHRARNLNVLFVRKIVKKLLHGDKTGYIYQWQKRNQFIRAVKYFDEGSLEDASHADIVILGSDEIWNVRRKKIYKFPVFFGSSIKNENLVSYAPAVNTSTLEDFQKKELLVNSLKRLKNVSVRDTYSQNIISVLLNRQDIEVVLDPTLLHKKNFYENIMVDNLPEQNYVLIYSYGENMNNNLINEIKIYAEKKQLKIISVLDCFEWCDYNLTVSPFEFLAFFRNADAVITDTFHGTIFSLIFNKNFAIMPNKSIKIKQLLETVRLQDRFITAEQTPEKLFAKQLDYTQVNEYIEVEREKSKKYLENVLGQHQK